MCVCVSVCLCMCVCMCVFVHVCVFFAGADFYFVLPSAHIGLFLILLYCCSDSFVSFPLSCSQSTVSRTAAVPLQVTVVDLNGMAAVITVHSFA